METIKTCPVCKSTKLELYLQSKDFLVTGEEFNIDECSDCTLLITNPQPDIKEISKYYDSEKYLAHSERRKTIIEKLYHRVKKRMIKRKIKLIKKYVGKKKINILDVGCGTGDFLKKCEKNKWFTLGFEPNAYARKKAMEKNIRIIGSNDYIDKMPSDTFDVITLWHVLEHMHDLEAVVKKLFSLLKQNGLLIIAIPEYMSYDAKVYKKFWASFDLPRHLYHFNEKSLSTCISAHNCELVNKKPLKNDSYYISYLSSRNKKRFKIFAMIFGFIIGKISNRKAKRGKMPYSSQIYVYRKTK